MIFRKTQHLFQLLLLISHNGNVTFQACHLSLELNNVLLQDVLVILVSVDLVVEIFDVLLLPRNDLVLLGVEPGLFFALTCEFLTTLSQLLLKPVTLVFGLIQCFDKSVDLSLHVSEVEVFCLNLSYFSL
jgi:hypothetical protein